MAKRFPRGGENESTLDVKALRIKLKDSLPGLAAQLQMVPEPRPGDKTYKDVENDCHRAGVLILLYPEGGRWHVLFTKRTERVLYHRGQISFPGGQLEPGEDARAAALRETEEELGVPRTEVEVIGELTPLYIPRSHYCIYPVVGLTDRRPDFHPHSEEVDEVIEVPLGHLHDPATLRRENWIIQGKEISVPFYSYQGHKIWGATSMILAEFLALVRSS